MIGKMIVTTTPAVEGRRIVEYKGIVFGEATFGAGMGTELKGLFAGITGKRSGSYEKKLHEIRMAAIGQMQGQAAELGANAVVGVDVDYEFITSASVLMISATGTAVIVE